jgi:hypothetical protein
MKITTTFNEGKSYQNVVSKEANKTNQIDVFQGYNFIDRVIIDNDYQL